MLAKIGFVFSVVALIFDTVGVALPDWYHWSVTVKGLTAEIKFGLWKCCTNVQLLESGCLTLEDMEIIVSKQIKTSRGLEILSLLLIAVSGSLAVFKVCARKDNKHILQVASMISCVAGLLTIVGAVVFVVGNAVREYLEENAFNGQVEMKPHTGFALCITSGLFCFVAALLYYIESRCRKNSVKSDES